MEVVSEVLPEFKRNILSQPQLDPKNVVSTVSINVPNCYYSLETLSKDEDGDYNVRRRGNSCIDLFLEHSVSTVLKEVGLQIWRGALLLSDFILNNPSIISGKNVIELGAGVGLTSLVAALLADNVICTDIQKCGILELLRCNINRNIRHFKGKINVLPLDFFDTNWPRELQRAIESADIILTADVIYDNEITDAFLQTLERLFAINNRITMYFALEKRYVFTVDDLDVVAPCYEHFLTGIKKSMTLSKLKMTEIPLNFPQKIEYNRVKELILWKINI